MMEPNKNGKGLDATTHLRRWANGLLMGESLLRARPVAEAHEFRDERSKVLLAEDKDVVEELALECAGEAFGEPRSCSEGRHEVVHEALQVVVADELGAKGLLDGYNFGHPFQPATQHGRR
ncbi:MAG TPA: hypothetical protein VKU41_19850 [Polyangiaceae bacterium]|nr:hypothetical protein [Polyangiaceae bacterium]